MFLFFQCQLAVLWDMGWMTDMSAGELLGDGYGVRMRLVGERRIGKSLNNLQLGDDRHRMWSKVLVRRSRCQNFAGPLAFPVYNSARIHPCDLDRNDRDSPYVNTPQMCLLKSVHKRRNIVQPFAIHFDCEHLGHCVFVSSTQAITEDSEGSVLVRI